MKKQATYDMTQMVEAGRQVTLLLLSNPITSMVITLIGIQAAYNAGLFNPRDPKTGRPDWASGSRNASTIGDIVVTADALKALSPAMGSILAGITGTPAAASLALAAGG